MGKKFALLFVALLLLFVPFAVSLEPEERLFFSTQYEKMQASYESKIDTQANRMEKIVKDEVASAKAQIRDEISKEIKAKLMVIAIGLGGMFIVIHALFKLVSLKLDYNRRIKRYEDKLKSQTKELDDLLESNKKYKAQLDSYRDQIVLAVQKERGIVNGVPTEAMGSGTTKKTFSFFKGIHAFLEKHNKKIKILLFIILLGITIFFVYKAGWIQDLLIPSPANETLANLTL